MAWFSSFDDRMTANFAFLHQLYDSFFKSRHTFMINASISVCLCLWSIILSPYFAYPEPSFVTLIPLLSLPYSNLPSIRVCNIFSLYSFVVKAFLACLCPVLQNSFTLNRPTVLHKSAGWFKGSNSCLGTNSSKLITSFGSGCSKDRLNIPAAFDQI